MPRVNSTTHLSDFVDKYSLAKYGFGSGTVITESINIIWYQTEYNLEQSINGLKSVGIVT